MSRYDNITTSLKINKGQVYNSALLPALSPSDTDIVILTTMGDRLDLLANEYYGDATMWWVIAAKNNLTDVPLTLSEGIVLRIPNVNEANQIKISIK